MKYRMKTGRWGRMENGAWKSYAKGDVLELSEAEAATIVMLIEPVQDSQSGVSKRLSKYQNPTFV